MKDLSIVICTYNRAQLLNFCLQSFVDQVTQYSFEVIIIDNNSTDNTYEICKHFVDEYSKFRYIKEHKQGLSHARNRAMFEAESNWVAYVDDDAKAHSDYVERAIWIIKNYDFDCFGGIYNAWYTIKKPRWITDDFGTNHRKQSYTGILEKEFMDGGNMIWKKDVLMKVGGFNPAIGMNGNKIGYGEETLIQELTRKANFSIGFDPLLQVDHYVQHYKLNVFWHIKSSYVLGKQYWEIFNKLPTKKELSFWAYQYIIRKFIIKSIINFPGLIFKKQYFWQNYILDVVKEFALEIGKLKSARKLVKHN